MSYRQLFLEVMGTFNNWIAFRRLQGATFDMNITPLTLLMYKTLDALYLETKNKLPLKTTQNVNKKPKEDADRITFALWLTDESYTALRTILALVGDLIFTSQMLRSLRGLAGLQSHVNNIFNESNKFRDARNFFTHMDHHLGNRIDHGVSGPKTIGCGVEFKSGTINNAYLIGENNTLYFNCNRDFCEVVIDRPAFNGVFSYARDLYDEIQNNPINQRAGNMIPLTLIYPP